MLTRLRQIEWASRACYSETFDHPDTAVDDCLSLWQGSGHPVKVRHNRCLPWTARAPAHFPSDRHRETCRLL